MTCGTPFATRRGAEGEEEGGPSGRLLCVRRSHRLDRMDDRNTVAVQLGRDPRGDVAVVARCPFGLPLAIRTSPRLEDGSPFPTLYCTVCPVAVREIGRLEAAGVMRELQQRLEEEPDLRDA